MKRVKEEGFQLRRAYARIDYLGISGRIGKPVAHAAS